jgi:hypothetical protein
MESRLARDYQKPAIFLLQPNQYLSGSKPLSQEERASAFNPAIADDYNKAMRLAQEAVPKLRSNGVKIYDLTQAFADVHETLYVDACCHFNCRGNEVLATALLKIPAQEGSKD